MYLDYLLFSLKIQFLFNRFSLHGFMKDNFWRKVAQERKGFRSKTGLHEVKFVYSLWTQRPTVDHDIYISPEVNTKFINVGGMISMK